MSKGLEALKDIKSRLYMESETQTKLIYKDLSIIKKELKEKEQYEEILNDYGLTLANFREACLFYAWLKSEKLNFDNGAKKLKALEIIKEKAVNVLMFKANFIVSKPEYEEYQYYLDNCEKYGFSAFLLSPEEYELLREVLL